MPKCNLQLGKRQAGNSLGVDAVLVNPEPKRHVGIQEEVDDSTTRYLGVLVSISVLELNECNAINRINLKLNDKITNEVIYKLFTVVYR